MIFTEERSNLNRQVEFDYVKALAVIGMIIIHVYEEFSTADLDVVCTGFLNNFIQFFGGPMVAPVYMTAMGLGVVYSQNREPGAIMRRGLQIMLLGYALNFVRGVIPYLIITGFIFKSYFCYYLLNVDILQFAGLALVLIGLLKKLKVPVLAMGVIAVAMQLLGQWLDYRYVSDSMLVNCLLGLFWHTGVATAFPLLNWFVYPVLGVIIGKYLRHVTDVDRLYKFLFGIAVTLLAGFCGTLAFLGYDLRSFYTLADDIYYRQNFLSVIFCILVVLIELSLAHFVVAKWKPTKLTACAKFLSVNVNVIYLVQWTLIGLSGILYWFELMPVITVERVIPLGLFYLAITIAIVILFRKIQKKKEA